MHRPLCLFLFLAACNLNPKPVDDSAVTDDSGGGGGGGGNLSIAEIRAGGAADGDLVTVKGVIVTSPITRDAEGFFIQDAKGGPRSGLYVWYPSGLDPFVVAQGDEVTIEGTISEYYGWTELKITGPDAIKNTGTGELPAAIDLGDGAGVNWDDYESTIVQISNQTVESVNAYNTGKLSSGLNLDDGFTFLDYTCGGVFESLTGIIFYQYEEHSLNPRTLDDLGAYTEGPTSDGTIADVQQGNICGMVSLTGLVATTDSIPDVDDGSVTFYAQDSGGGEYSGMPIYVKGELSIQAGDVVNVVGSAGEFYDLTQLYLTDPAGVTPTGTTAEPVSVTLTAAPADWEPYEGTLLTLQNVSATSDEDDYGQVNTNYNLMLDDELVRFDAVTGTTWSSVTGVLTYTYGEWKLWPRSAADLAE